MNTSINLTLIILSFLAFLIIVALVVFVICSASKDRKSEKTMELEFKKIQLAYREKVFEKISTLSEKSFIEMMKVLTGN